MRLVLSLWGLLVVGLGCLGDRGPQGTPGQGGPGGPVGDAGPSGTSPCTQPGGLSTTVTVSSPTNGSFFVAGERPAVTITFASDCGKLVAPADLELAELFVYGPRAPTQTVTAYGLMNFAGGTFRAQSLKDPKYASDAGAPNMTLAADNTVTYTLNPITSETLGTYTAAVWMYTDNRLVQDFALADFQVGTATPEVFASGPADASTCRNCHTNRATGGKTYMAHIVPGSVPGSTFGDFALDSLPIGSCKACHNNLGYSPNPILRKTHSVHRGEHMSAPGSAHPEYGYGRDLTLLLFTNVGFPAMPTGGMPGVALPASVAMEKDCTTCHVDDAWQTRPSRAACGSCHDNVFFAGAPLPDGGVDPSATAAAITPPTVLGFPSANTPCTNNASCSALSSLATCNTSTGNCELTTHAKQTDDAQCATCHAPTNGISPIADAHAISPFNPPISLEGYTFKNVTVTGGTGSGGSFVVGDTLKLKFQLFDNTGASVDLQPGNTTTSPWAGTFLVAGPTSNPQRVFGFGSGGLNMKTQGSLTYDAPSQTYTFVPTVPAPGTWPASSLPPINHPAAGTQTNPPGSYTVWFYWARTTSGVRDAVDAQVAVAFGVSQKASGRQVVTQAACGSCHGMTESGFPHLALHGGQRKNGETCSTCHSQNAFDRVVGATGAACTTGGQCAGNAAGWEACVANVCTVTVDPTPGIVIDYQQLVHNIHFARLREGYAERKNIGLPTAGIQPKTLNYLGFNNSLLDFQEILAPVDVRSCTNCHQDTGASCSDSSPCGYGQTCTSGKCRNTAWQNATARACITCHDSAESAAHAAQNTSSSGVESCPVCHDPDAIVPVATAHNITSPYVPPYPREKE